MAARPKRVASSQPGSAGSVEIALGRIGREDERGAGLGRRARGVEDEPVRGGPRRVADVLGVVAPRRREALLRVRAVELVGRDDGDGLGARAGGGEAALLLGGPDLLRVLQLARGDDRVRRRDGDGEVVVAVFEVELALPEVGERVPPVHVVEHDHARVPLRDLVDGPALDIEPAHPVCPVLGHDEAPADLQLEHPAVRRRARRGGRPASACRRSSAWARTSGRRGRPRCVRA